MLFLFFWCFLQKIVRRVYFLADTPVIVAVTAVGVVTVVVALFVTLGATEFTFVEGVEATMEAVADVDDTGDSLVADTANGGDGAVAADEAKERPVLPLLLPFFVASLSSNPSASENELKMGEPLDLTESNPFSDSRSPCCKSEACNSGVARKRWKHSSATVRMDTSHSHLVLFPTPPLPALVLRPLHITA
jgi:hypothetical protein